MALARKTIDRATLPAAMMELAKAQLRVDFPDDDVLIRFKLTHSIDLFERLTGFSVFATNWVWTPEAIDAERPPSSPPADMIAGGQWSRVPVMRVSDWAAIDSGGVDVKAAYALYGTQAADSVAPQYLYPVADRTSVGLVTTLSTGFETLDQLAPGIIDIVLRTTAWLYEYREVENVPGVDNVVYANSLLTGWWVARC